MAKWEFILFSSGVNLYILWLDKHSYILGTQPIRGCDECGVKLELGQHHYHRQCGGKDFISFPSLATFSTCLQELVQGAFSGTYNPSCYTCICKSPETSTYLGRHGQRQQLFLFQFLSSRAICSEYTSEEGTCKWKSQAKDQACMYYVSYNYLPITQVTPPLERHEWKNSEGNSSSLLKIPDLCPKLI